MDVGLLGEHVLGKREHDRPRPARGGDGERPRDRLRQRVDVPDLVRPLRERREHRLEIDLLERLTAAILAGDLTDEQEHRRRVLERDVDTGRGVGRTGPTRDEADARASGELAVRLGHARRARLHAAHDELDLGGVVERVERGEVALAGDAEDAVGPVEPELVDEDPAARPHREMGRSKNTVALCCFGLFAFSGSR